MRQCLPAFALLVVTSLACSVSTSTSSIDPYQPPEASRTYCGPLSDPFRLAGRLNTDADWQAVPECVLSNGSINLSPERCRRLYQERYGESCRPWEGVGLGCGREIGSQYPGMYSTVTGERASGMLVSDLQATCAGSHFMAGHGQRIDGPGTLPQDYAKVTGIDEPPPCDERTHVLVPHEQIYGWWTYWTCEPRPPVQE